MIRAEEICYPEHFPKRMDDSAGMNQFDHGVFRQMPITALPSHTHTHTQTETQPQSQPQTLSPERDPDTKTGQRYNQ